MPSYVVQKVADALNEEQPVDQGLAPPPPRDGVQGRRPRHAGVARASRSCASSSPGGDVVVLRPVGAGDRARRSAAPERRVDGRRGRARRLRRAPHAAPPLPRGAPTGSRRAWWSTRGTSFRPAPASTGSDRAGLRASRAAAPCSRLVHLPSGWPTRPAGQDLKILDRVHHVSRPRGADRGDRPRAGSTTGSARRRLPKRRSASARAPAATPAPRCRRDRGPALREPMSRKRW